MDMHKHGMGTASLQCSMTCHDIRQNDGIPSQVMDTSQGPFSKIARQLQYKRDTYDQDRVSHKNMKVYDDTDAM